MIKIKRALISVSDKTGIVELAKILRDFDCEIISTGGTQKVLESAGIKVTDIGEVTGNPEAFGGRMKTISFNVESALLFDRERDREEAEKLNIKPIDMVVCNLYPFEDVIAREETTLEEAIEMIDIGGPTQIRAAAKSFPYVTVIPNPGYYDSILKEMHENQGKISLQTRMKLAQQVFSVMSLYDATIANRFHQFLASVKVS